MFSLFQISSPCSHSSKLAAHVLTLPAYNPLAQQASYSFPRNPPFYLSRRPCSPIHSHCMLCLSVCLLIVWQRRVLDNLSSFPLFLIYFHFVYLHCWRNQHRICILLPSVIIPELCSSSILYQCQGFLDKLFYLLPFIHLYPPSGIASMLCMEIFSAFQWDRQHHWVGFVLCIVYISLFFSFSVWEISCHFPQGRSAVTESDSAVSA